MRPKLRYLACVVVIICATLNIAQFTRHVINMPPRQSDDRIIWEQRLEGIRNALRKAGYTSGNIGYMPQGVLNGKARTEREDVDWVQVRYAMIPLNVLQDSVDAPYVIAESTHSLEGFTTLYDGRNGWILLQRKVPQ
jgi:hypothetical protein